MTNHTLHDADLRAGSIIADDYVLQHQEWASESGTRWEAVHSGVGREVVVDVLGSSWTEFPARTHRFCSEMKTLSTVRHPGVIEILAAGTRPDGRPYVVREPIRGTSVRETLRSTGAFEPHLACRIVADIARGLSAVHRCGVVHGDVGPHTVVVDGSSGSARLVGFGSWSKNYVANARHGGADFGGYWGLPVPESSPGSPPTRAADIYALGLLLLEMLTGIPPLVEPQRDSARSYLGAVAKRWPKLAAPILVLVCRCLQPDPSLRPSSAAAVADHLEAIYDKQVAETASDSSGAPASGGPWLISTIVALLTGFSVWITTMQ